MRWIEPAMGDPLAHCQLWRQSCEFAEQLDRADMGDAKDTCQQIVLLLYVVVASDQRHGFPTQF
jgi:hypothetical protein